MFSWNTTRKLNVAETLFARSDATAVARKERVEKIIPATVQAVLKQVETAASTELKPKFAVVNVSNLFGVNTPLMVVFSGSKSGIPKPTDEELKTIIKGVKETLENPEKYGFVVRDHVNSMDCLSKFIQVDWNTPVVPVEPEQFEKDYETEEESKDNIEPEKKEE